VIHRYNHKIHCFYLSIILLVLSIDHCFEYKLWLLLKKTQTSPDSAISHVHVFIDKQNLIATPCRGFLLHFVSFFFRPRCMPMNCAWPVSPWSKGNWRMHRLFARKAVPMFAREKRISRRGTSCRAVIVSSVASFIIEYSSWIINSRVTRQQMYTKRFSFIRRWQSEGLQFV